MHGKVTGNTCVLPRVDDASSQGACDALGLRDKGKKKKKGDGEDGSGGGDDDDEENGDANGAEDDDDVVWMTDTSEAAAQVRSYVVHKAACPVTSRL